jgi:thiamine biosynthesis lipoprotein
VPQLFRRKSIPSSARAALVAFGTLAGCANRGSPSNEPIRSAPPVVVSNAPPRAAVSATVTPSASAAASSPPVAAAEPQKVEMHATAMGTTVTFIAFTSARVNEGKARAAMGQALEEMRHLEALMSEWRDDSEIGQVNAHAGEPVHVSPETLDVVQKGLWAGKVSGGVFDITFQAMSGLWKFGSAQEPNPRVPSPAAIAAAKKHIDYRKVEVSEADQTVRIGKDQKLGLGGIAKGYIVDRAARVLRDAGLDSFLVQAGGDLYGAGKKPDGSHWVSGIQDPRAPQGHYFATLDLDDHAFSTAGDYARSYVLGGKRYHHIIDPRTGYPATACRSVTVWAPDAFIADAIDDAVFILGPEKGLALVESLENVGVVIVDKQNHVTVSPRLENKVHLLAAPTDGI